MNLLPCPFCRSVPISHFVGDEDGGYWEVECLNHTTRPSDGPALFVGVHGCDQESAEKAWNTRAAITEQPLSRQWREGAEKLLKTARNRYEQGFAYGRIKSADDLDSCHDEGREENRRLRLLLALSYSGGNLYADDGELQDASEHPFIDWKRDSIDELERKVKERGYDRIRNHLEGDSDV